MTKRLSLGPGGELVKDSSACWLSAGTVTAWIRRLRDLAEDLRTLGPSEAWVGADQEHRRAACVLPQPGWQAMSSRQGSLRSMLMRANVAGRSHMPLNPRSQTWMIETDTC